MKLNILEAYLEPRVDKAHGPESFSITFYRSCWDIVKGDLLEVLQQIYADKD